MVFSGVSIFCFPPTYLPPGLLLNRTLVSGTLTQFPGA